MKVTFLAYRPVGSKRVKHEIEKIVSLIDCDQQRGNNDENITFVLISPSHILYGSIETILTIM